MSNKRRKVDKVIDSSVSERLSCPTCHATNHKGLRKKVRVKSKRLQCAECGYNQPISVPKKKINTRETTLEQDWNKIGTSCGTSHDQIIGKIYDPTDKRVIKIIKAISAQHHERQIAKITTIPLTTVHRIIKFLLITGEIEPIKQISGKSFCQAYKIVKKTPKIGTSLVGDEERKAEACCRSHHQKWKFELIHEQENLKRAKSISCINTTHLHNNQTKDFFRDSGNTVRVTTKHVVIFVKKRLQTDDIDNLIAKYIQLAKDEARQFCSEHNITVNPIPTKYQGNDFDILSADPLAKMMLERGTFNVNADGIKYRVDPSDEGIEAKEEDAKEILFRLHGMRPLISTLQQDIKEIKETLTEVKNRQHVSEEVTAMEKQISELREQLKDFKGIVHTVASEPTPVLEKITNNDPMFG